MIPIQPTGLLPTFANFFSRLRKNFSLRLEHLPDRLLGQLRMAMHFGVGDAFIEQPSVHLVVGLEPQPWREEALTHEPDLVLDLTLLPARCRGAGDRLDEIVAAHLQEAAIVEAVLADED